MGFRKTLIPSQFSAAWSLDRGRPIPTSPRFHVGETARPPRPFASPPTPRTTRFRSSPAAAAVALARRRRRSHAVPVIAGGCSSGSRSPAERQTKRLSGDAAVAGTSAGEVDAHDHDATGSVKALALIPVVSLPIKVTEDAERHSSSPSTMDLSLHSYQKFMQFALDATQIRTTLTPIASQEKFKFMKAKDDKTVLHALSYQAPKIRLLRSLTIEGGRSMQVFDFAALPEPSFDAPIFCANFFTNASLSIILLDLNPLYDVTIQRDYKEKYYRKLMAVGQKYAELLPWGDMITSESLRFFSPIVIWTKFSHSQYKHDVLYSAFMDYFEAWLELMEQAMEATDAMQIARNCEAQHRYLSWRAEKDPGHPILKKLIGESLARDLVRQFLFEGVDSLGAKTFLDYFPEYRTKDGTINQKRSIIGKSYETRPWDARGEFVGNKPG